ncbi:hypothetical protein PR048_026723 [Dryococelus australis]|uniref:Transposase n=1 Tax=Dryococelus australis TaxID=614101 RepID=A0ABQ9GM53_9NEOP|nr:hypothetical protein PR048_026723 [Dryococelus australis]
MTTNDKQHYQTICRITKKGEIGKQIFIEETTYINKYIPGSGDITQASTLRKNYVPLVSEAMQEQIKQAVQNKQIAIVADETTDSFGKCVFVVLFVHHLQHQAILELLNKYNVNVVGLVSYSVWYIETCFAALKTILGEKFIHFQCWAHKICFIDDSYLTEFEKLNTLGLVTKIKMAFLHLRKIQNVYITYSISQI